MSAGEVVSSVLWQSPDDRSTELCRLVATSSGFALEGLVLVPIEGEPARVEYHVDADRQWIARGAHLVIESPGSIKVIDLAHQGDAWTVDGHPREELDGCVDVDLRVTPATNTLPIRRLELDVGQRAEVRAAWVAFPELEVEPLEQSYERLSEDTYRYRSGAFEADLVVDRAGLVIRYGTQYWSAVARAC
jgi:uncharacterized protein